jgi:hypothetical protein
LNNKNREFALKEETQQANEDYRDATLTNDEKKIDQAAEKIRTLEKERWRQQERHNEKIRLDKARLRHDRSKHLDLISQRGTENALAQNNYMLNLGQEQRIMMQNAASEGRAEIATALDILKYYDKIYGTDGATRMMMEIKNSKEAFSEDPIEAMAQAAIMLKLKPLKTVGTPKKVEDAGSPTGWAWKDQQGNVILGAPPPSTSITEIEATPEGTKIKTFAGVRAHEVSQLKKLSDAKTRGTQSVQLVDQLASLANAVAKGGDEALSFTGGAARFLNTLVKQGKAAAKVFGFTLPDVSIFEKGGDMEGVIPTKSPALTSTVIQSKLVSAAYAIALLYNTTRPTDADFKNALKTLAANSGDSKVMALTIQNLAEDAMRSFRIDYQENTGLEWDWSEKMSKYEIEWPTNFRELVKPLEGDGNVINLIFRDGKFWYEDGREYIGD